MTEQLKPCPFCGDKAKYYLAGNESLGYQPGVTCIKCLANVHGRFVEPGELGQEAEDVINRWNRRAKPERKVEPVAWMCPNDPDSASAFSWKPTKCNCGTERVPVGVIPKEQSDE